MIRFLLGPAGSGKTHRCLDEIRRELALDPDRPPLLLIAPKQATYQLERRLLEEPSLPGWNRLQVLSFERLARQILAETRPADFLDEETRIMVLRALLRRHQSALRIFKSTARLTGFAQEVSSTFRELQSSGCNPEQLDQLSAQFATTRALADKFHDLAVLLRHYHTWLKDHHVADADTLLDLAADAVRHPDSGILLQGLWLDGFAEMTRQEIELLAAVVSRSREATLAFCLDLVPDDDGPWRAPGAVIRQTFLRLQSRLQANPGHRIQIEALPHDSPEGRFAGQPTLAHLERSWSTAASSPFPAEGIRLVECAHFEHEAECAAREVWRSVRRGARFRDLAVLVRSLQDTQDILQQVFTRFEIPFFLDRRTPLSHHPLAELTRSALRLATLGWNHDDWFGALKTGLTAWTDALVDTLENEALARGWDTEFWRRAATGSPLPDTPSLPSVNLVITPFLKFIRDLGVHPEAARLCEVIRALWDQLDVDGTLRVWSDPKTAPDADAAFLHQSAREQLHTWLEGVRMGFGGERLPLAEWLPILESGLASLTAGVIPPAQDQVLIGAVDRSRQPELRVALVLGLNETVFPAPPPAGGLFTEVERQLLLAHGRDWLVDRRRRIGHERFYGYIALTRARERLVLTWSERDAAGRPLNASPFIRHLQRVFPNLEVERDAPSPSGPEVVSSQFVGRIEHRADLLPWLLRIPSETPLDTLVGTGLRPVWLHRQRHEPTDPCLPPAIAHALHGSHPEASVGALESLGACPFQFFVRHSLRGSERARLDADPRHIGSFAHALLARFHQDIAAHGLQWREVTPEDARIRLRRLADQELQDYGLGVFNRTPEARWQADRLIERLQDVVATLVHWATASDFDPAHAEMSFGGESPVPAWEIPLHEGHSLRIRGKIDRFDLFRPKDGPSLVSVIDYKLRPRKPDNALMTAGIDLQLVAYALALSDLAPSIPELQGAIPVAAGMFFVGLLGSPPRQDSRTTGTDPRATAALHIHRGRCRLSAVEHLDRGTPKDPSGQFSLRIKVDGAPWRGGDVQEDADFDDLLARAQQAIRQAGTQILEGDIRVLPYHKGAQTACQRCDLLAICRFDPASQPYRKVPGGPPARRT